MSATKASGFRGSKNDKWWTKDSKFGIKYQCSACGKITLGMHGSGDARMHWSTCNRQETTVADGTSAGAAKVNDAEQQVDEQSTPDAQQVDEQSTPDAQQVDEQSTPDAQQVDEQSAPDLLTNLSGRCTTTADD